VKNLPYTTVVHDLHELFSPFGTLSRVILPPTKAIALVEFAESNDAKRAFRSLAYKRFKHVPLYLEWTPEAIFLAPVEVKKTPIAPRNLKRDQIEEEEIDQSDSSTLYVKNLNFSTTEEVLKQLFISALGESKVRSVRIAKSRGKVSQSLGYGFVELADKSAAVKALKLVQGKELEDHKLLLKFSQSNAKPKAQTKRKTAAKAPEKPTSTKLMIRNLAFEAQRKDLRDLCR
jgi:multiple RNA-binding domain-containing protein 1